MPGRVELAGDGSWSELHSGGRGGQPLAAGESDGLFEGGRAWSRWEGRCEGMGANVMWLCHYYGSK